MNAKRRCELEGRCVEVVRELEMLSECPTDTGRLFRARREIALLKELDRMEYELGLDDNARRHPRMHRRTPRPSRNEDNCLA
jgi:hypothetical protein